MNEERTAMRRLGYANDPLAEKLQWVFRLEFYRRRMVFLSVPPFLLISISCSTLEEHIWRNGFEV